MKSPAVVTRVKCSLAGRSSFVRCLPDPHHVRRIGLGRWRRRLAQRRKRPCYESIGPGNVLPGHETRLRCGGRHRSAGRFGSGPCVECRWLARPTRLCPVVVPRRPRRASPPAYFWSGAGRGGGAMVGGISPCVGLGAPCAGHIAGRRCRVVVSPRRAALASTRVCVLTCLRCCHCRA